MKTFKQIYGEFHMKNWGLWPTANQKLRNLPTAWWGSCLGSRPSPSRVFRWCSHSQLLKSLRQNHPANLLPNSWPTAWDINVYYCFKPLRSVTQQQTTHRTILWVLVECPHCAPTDIVELASVSPKAFFQNSQTLVCFPMPYNYHRSPLRPVFTPPGHCPSHHHCPFLGFRVTLPGNLLLSLYAGLPSIRPPFC